MRQSAFRAALVALLLASAGSAFAEEAPKPPPPPEWKFALHGLLGGSLFVQDGFLAPSAGQQALWAAGAPANDKYMMGGDIRQNRLNFSIAGPSVLGAIPRGVAEVDFFGGNGPGGFGDVSVFPRARVMFAELGWANTTLRIGQDFSLIAGINTLAGPATAGAMAFPTSVGHIAFPIAYGAGAIGWRYPGLFLYHRIPMGENKMEIALEIARSGWANPANPGVANTTTGAVPFSTINTDLGSASGLPQLEARLTYAMGSVLGITVTGHYNQVDPSGWGVDPTGTCAVATPTHCDTKTVYALGGNFRINMAPFVLQGGGFIGQNTSPLLGEILQFPNLGAGDVSDWGAWAQAGFNLTKEFGIYAMAGTEHPSYDDAYKAGLGNLSNAVFSGMARYFVNGYAFGFEWTHWHTRTRGPAAAPAAPETAIDVNQYMLSSYYFF